ncbi:MAG: Protein FecR [Delftia tsuruhatensis]|nr:MAG: Protein FecR [Delftia tsuruhatensis]
MRQIDGSQLDGRLLQLLHGEILVSTAADPQRPFLVGTQQGMLRALGTRFLVRQQARLCTVSVLEGAVEVQPNAGRPVVIEAGKQARFSDEQIVATGDNDPAAGAWSKGMLIVHRMPLADFAAELARYRPGHLGCAEAVANLPVSGIYPVDDTDRVLDMLSKTLPVRVRSVTRYWVSIDAHA